MQNDVGMLAVPYSAIVGAVLQHLRKARGITQAQMAAAMALSQSGYSRVELGDTPLTVEQLAAAARRCGVQPHEILVQADVSVIELSAGKFLAPFSVAVFRSRATDAADKTPQISRLPKEVADGMRKAMTVGTK